MKFDPDKVRKLVSEVLTALERLEDLRQLPEGDFVADPHKVGSAKYHLIVAIEGAVDLCHHLIARNGLRTPEDYADTFRVMEERGAFDSRFTATMIQMARFRNRLVHIYWDVDDKGVHRILQERLGDIRLFLKKYGQIIGSGPPGRES